MNKDIESKNNKPFTRLPNEIFNKILISDFGKRERKAFDLILRLSYGCFNRNYCFLRKVDFEAVGIGSAKIKVVLDSLEDKNIIIIEKEQNILKLIINKDIDLWKVKMNGSEEQLAKLVGNNLPKRKHMPYRYDNNEFTEMGRRNFEKAFGSAKEECLKEKDKDKLKKNNKEKYIINNNSKKGIEEARSFLMNDKGFYKD